jgi:hypothetical protein
LRGLPQGGQYHAAGPHWIATEMLKVGIDTRKPRNVAGASLVFPPFAVAPFLLTFGQFENFCDHP